MIHGRREESPRFSMRMCALCFWMCLAAMAAAAPEAPPRPTLAIARAAGPIVIDGDLSEGAWRTAANATDFTQFLPIDRVRPKSATSAYVTYDDRMLYVGFVCDDDPAQVRATLTDRDRMYSDDFVGIILDTYGDAAWAYEFYVNPLGVQGDMRWLASGEEDTRFDVVYYSAARVTDSGWQAEIAIPFSSLRFPDRPEQNWRATFWRSHPRQSTFKYFWAAITQDMPCVLCELGYWTGIRDVKPGSRLELLPALIAYQSGGRDEDDLTTVFESGDAEAEGELNVRYRLTPGLTAEATVNPDFSQVESDAAEIDVNTTYALSYPERRPFFQEGSDLYGTAIPAIYTRAVNDPSIALKLTGRQGRTSFFFLAAVDDTSLQLIPLEEETEYAARGKSYAAIGRVRRTFADDSYLGALFTDRRLDAGDGSGTVFGIDGALRVREKYLLSTQMLGSYHRESGAPGDAGAGGEPGPAFDDEGHTVSPDGEAYSGMASYTQFQRYSRRWELEISHTATSPTFRADNGFIQRAGIQEADVEGSLSFRPNGKLVTTVTTALHVGRLWAWDGGRKDEWIMPEIAFELPCQTELYGSLVLSREQFRGVWFKDIRRVEGEVSTRVLHSFRAGAAVTYGNSIARMDNPVMGRELSAGFEAIIKPLQQFTIEPTWEYYRIRDRETGERLEEGYITRTRFNYQFTRELFARLVVQYDDFDDRLNFEPLLTYKLNPFTIFYIGAAFRHGWDDERGIDGRLIQRQFFVKFQYLLRA